MFGKKRRLGISKWEKRKKQHLLQAAFRMVNETMRIEAHQYAPPTVRQARKATTFACLDLCPSQSRDQRYGDTCAEGPTELTSFSQR